MPFQTNGGIRFFQFDSFRGRVKHAFLARLGGVSPAPWRSLNLGGTVGDEPQRVQENRRLAFSTLGLDLVSLFDVWQVHGVEVAIADTPRRLDTPRQRADAILSNSPSVTLLMRFADCVPVLLFDPIHAVIGMVHAGWMGTVNGTLRAALNAMQERYGSQPGALYSGIGPSIGPDTTMRSDRMLPRRSRPGSVLSPRNASRHAPGGSISTSGRPTATGSSRQGYVRSKSPDCALPAIPTTGFRTAPNMAAPEGSAR